jgi:hypothetical protein
VLHADKDHVGGELIFQETLIVVVINIREIKVKSKKIENHRSNFYFDGFYIAVVLRFRKIIPSSLSLITRRGL